MTAEDSSLEEGCAARPLNGSICSRSVLGFLSLIGLEGFDGIVRRIIQQNLLAAIAAHNVVAKLCSAQTQRLDQTGKIFDLDLDAIPASRCRLPSIRHELGRAA